MKKIRLIQQIVNEGVIAVLRGETSEEVIRMADEAIRGGIRIIEVTMTVPGALRVIEHLVSRYASAHEQSAGSSDQTDENGRIKDDRFKDDQIKDDRIKDDGIKDDQTSLADRAVIVGAGTVLDPETARAAILSGAEFIVGPSLNPHTIALCNRYRVPIMPGVMTIQEIQTALELGVDIVKLFPGNLYNPGMIRAIKGPLPQANIMPTGGVSLSNIADWVKAGAVAVGIGSDLTAEAVKSGNYALIAEKAAQYVGAYRAARGS